MARWRLPAVGDHAGLPLDGFFALNPAMPVFARLYKEKRALVVHAVATNYRDRSHFDGQDVLESGYPGPNRTDSGWLNRAIALLPAAGGAPTRGLGVGVTAPLVMRGPAPVLGLGAARSSQCRRRPGHAPRSIFTPIAIRRSARPCRPVSTPRKWRRRAA